MKKGAMTKKRMSIIFLAALHLVSSAAFSLDISQLPAPYCEVEKIYPFDPFGWFNEQKQAVLRRLMEKNHPKVVVELGSLLGKSTRFIAQQLPLGGRVYAVDHWKGNLEHQDLQRTDIYPKLEHLYERFLSNIIHANLCDRVIPVRATSLEALNMIEESPDFVFVDASHEYEDVLCDLAGWYPRIHSGGVLCGDDWDWGAPVFPVRKAVIYFASQNELKVFSEGAIWWIFKD
jgi:Predicted O-methyltransferase